MQILYRFRHFFLPSQIQTMQVISTVAHKGHYALFHNIFRIIKYAFQIMHNTFPNSSKHILNSLHISKSSQHISKSSQHISKSSQHISKSRNTFRNLHNTFAPGPQVLAEKKETVTQLLLLPSMLCFVPRVENLCKFRSNFVLNAGRILPQISLMEAATLTARKI